MLRPHWLALALLALSCGGADRARPAAPAPTPDERLLVFGDVQLAGPFKAEPTLSAWKRGALDTSELAKRFEEALRDAKPTQILHTGDLVDLNESAVLELRSPGRAATRLPQGWPEWAPMLALLPREPKVYPVVGNHERYGELVVRGELAPDGDHVEIHDLELTSTASPARVHEAMLTHFPHLRDGAEFHGQSGSYVSTFAHFCLLSLDGADFDGDPSLFGFVDTKLVACKAQGKTAVVSIHYPLFTGRPPTEDDSLELAKHRTRLLDAFSRHGVALVFSGHEHFYLRYLDAGLAQAQLAAKPSALPIYVTVSDFANPYSRKLERVPGTATEGVRYFRGTHYVTVTFSGREARVVAKGFDRSSGKWQEIDSFSVGR